MAGVSNARDPRLKSASRPLRRVAVALTLAVLAGGAAVTFVVFQRAGPDSQQLRREASLAAAAGRWQDARRLLDGLAKPTSTDRLLQAVVAAELKQYDAASAYLDLVPDDRDHAARVALLRGRVELGRFHARRAEEALVRALRSDPKQVEARRLLIYLYGVQGRRTGLMEQFAALSDLNALNFDSARHWCIAHQERIQDPAELQSTLERFVASDPEDRWSRLALADVYRQGRAFDRANEVLSSLPASDPEAIACRAEVELDRGQLDQATQLLLSGPKRHAKLARLRARLAAAQHDWPRAVDQFRIAEVLDPNHADTIYGLSRALQMSGDPVAATAYTRRSTALRTLRDSLEALKDRDPKVACFQLAEACESAGYLPEARACYRLVISMDPLNKQAQQSVFRLAARAGRSNAVAVTESQESAGP